MLCGYFFQCAALECLAHLKTLCGRTFDHLFVGAIIVFSYESIKGRKVGPAVCSTGE